VSAVRPRLPRPQLKRDPLGAHRPRMRALGSLVVLLLTSTLGRAQQNAPATPPVDPHHHVVPVHQAPWTTELAPDARMVRLEGRAAGSDSVLSPDGRWRAFVIDRNDEPGGRVCLEAVHSGRRYELRGLPLPYRPLSALVWLDSARLAFDRWSQPHYGIHYVLDVSRRRLVLAAPFPDEFLLRQQAPGRDTGGPPP